MPIFSKRSQARLGTCDPRLQSVFNEVIKHRDCTIIDGHRSPEIQHALFLQGKSKIDGITKLGKHNHSPSQAVDASPWPIPQNWGEDHSKDKVIFYMFAAEVIYEAKKQGIKIRWGGDWDMDGDFKDQSFDDLVHFEIVED